MKKNLAKIFATASVIVAFILIMILIVTTFGGIKTEDFDHKLVKGLLVTISVLYFLLAAVTLVLLFITDEAVKEITVRIENGGAVRVSAAVVTKMIKKATKDIDGVKIKKLTLIADDFGIRLKLNVKVVDRDVVEAETYIRTLINDMFKKEFDFQFNAIEVRVMELVPKYKVDNEMIEKEVAARLAEIRKEEAEAAEHDAEQAEEQPVEQPAEQEEPAEAEQAEAEEAVEEEKPEAEEEAEQAEAEQEAEQAEQTPAEEE